MGARNVFDKVPAWVAWLAQDADGAWWGYEAEPNQQDRGWYENEVGTHRAPGKNGTAGRLEGDADALAAQV
jgi:hypothetical protein